jgi:hypothetical protein
MANRRHVKKDIEYITYEVLNDCFLSIETHPDRKRDEITKIINDAVIKRNELIKKVNQKIKDKKETKKHFKNIYEDLFKSADSYFSRLSELLKN